MERKKTSKQKKQQAGGAVILVGLLGGAIWYFSRKKNAVKNLEVNVTDVRFNKIKNITEALVMKLKVVVEIINPSSESLSFKSFVGNVTYAGDMLGTFKLYDPVIIKPQGTTKIEVPVTVNAIGLLTKIWETIQSKSVKTVNVKGLLKVGGMEFPINETVDLASEI